MIDRIKSKYNEFYNDTEVNPIINAVSAAGDFVILGGAVRDWGTGRKPQDIDIVVNLASSQLDALVPKWATKTSLGGWRIQLNNYTIDIWSLEHNLAHKLGLTNRKDLMSLSEVSFFDIDGCLYFPKTDVLVNDKLINVLTTGILSINLLRPKYLYSRAVKSINLIDNITEPKLF